VLLFSSYVLAKKALLYKKRVHKMLLKLTAVRVKAVRKSTSRYRGTQGCNGVVLGVPPVITFLWALGLF
jgi:hypothetical protein